MHEHRREVGGQDGSYRIDIAQALDWITSTVAQGASIP
jgi:hypothetical protein